MRIIYISLLCVFVYMMVSCKKDFLEIVPKGRSLAVTTNDYDLIFNSLSLYNNFGMDGQIPMGDEVASFSNFFSISEPRSQRLFRWEDEIYLLGERSAEITAPMSNLYVYNTIINGVMSSTGGADSTKSALQAEAMACRAYTYFWLINYFGKPYNESTAANDPGYPIVKDADVTNTAFTRASVKEVYDFMISDLKTAIPRMPVIAVHRTRMSKIAAEALLGQVYMFMGKHAEALPYLEDAFSHLGNTNYSIRLYDYNTEMNAGGAWALNSLGVPALPVMINNLENVFARQVSSNWNSTGWANYHGSVLLTPEASDLYGASDKRNHFFHNMVGTTTLPGKLRVRRSPGVIPIGVTLTEMYLLRAECRARMNNLPGAVSDIEFFRTKRMPAADAAVPASIASNRENLVRFILEERIREYALNGFRWFDMRRLSVDSEFSSTVKTQHIVYDPNMNTAQTFTLRPERLVLRFPQVVMLENPGMQNNP